MALIVSISTNFAVEYKKLSIWMSTRSVKVLVVRWRSDDVGGDLV